MKRRMFLPAIMSVALFCFIGEASAQQVIKLFNGKDLSNWDFIVDKNAVPADQVYSVKDGVIHIKGNPFGYMYTKEKYDNYKLHVEWRWPQEATNSGIFLLIEDVKNPFPNGIECQLAAGNAGDFVCLGGSDLAEFIQRPGEKRPAFPVVKKANATSEKPVGEWNEANIWVKNGTITVFINGVYQNTGTNKVKAGHIGLQSEGKDIQFRNIQIVK
ncbi:MAG: DUF1080 domain-containing protein [Tannerellaceae bacterium]|jgi:hypothetical protein|nr:DUF1080 domain-containing protein [Tannerellaceae bacterium]